MRRRLGVRALVLLAVLQLTFPVPVALAVDPVTYTVTSADDTGGSTCDAICTLRQAINAANANAAALPDSIVFEIAGVGPHTISPGTGGLPTITGPVVIDGTTQDGFTSCADGLAIEIEGSSAGSGASGLVLSGGAGASIVRGFAINRFGTAGINSSASGAAIRCNFVGTDPTGSLILANTFGVLMNQPGTVGGTGIGDGNLISGNVIGVNVGANGVVIQGNSIGTDRTGTLDLGNTNLGIAVASSSATQIGGSAAGAGNLISGNGTGIRLFGPNNVVEGNRIGTQANGVSPLGNSQSGIQIGSSGGPTGNIVGGTGPGSGNVIAFNSGFGVFVQDNVDTTINNRILGNSIHSNGPLVGPPTVLGIDLGGGGVRPNDAGDADVGPNHFQNFPVLTAATSGAPGTISGTLDSGAGTFRIELFGNAACDPSGHGEGEIYLGSVATLSNTPFTFQAPLAVNDVVTATATDAAGNTSEFSLCRAVEAATPTFTVNTTDDTNDGACTTVHCSLREAINRANSVVGTDTIGFAIAGSGPHTISPAAELPVVTDPVVIDATTQPGFASCTSGPVIELDGSSAVGPGAFVAGLKVTAGSSTIRGLVINRFSGDAMLLTSNGGNVVQCNWIGTDVTGTIARPNGFRGLAATTPNNTIGGTSVNARNVFAGNSNDAGVWLAGPDATGNVVQGNYVGIDATGTADLGNTYGIYVFAEASGNQIGGVAPGAGNVVSGNQLGIILEDAGNNVVEGNRIGLAATGTTVIGNTSHGVWIHRESDGNRVGGTPAGAGNVIAGNNDGVNVEPFDTSVPEGNAILGNSIYGNAGLGIDLDLNGVTVNDAGDSDGGANERQNFPTITSATPGAPGTISGTVDSGAGSFRVELFVSPSCDPSGHGEGQAYLGFVDTTANSTFSFNGALTAGDFVTATATDPSESTSEFSQCVMVAASGVEPCDPAPDNPILPGTGPANLRLDGQPPVGGRPKYEDDACLYLFEEQQQVALPQTINPVAPSAQNMARGTGPTRELPAGTIVSSFLLHGDAVGSPTAAPATISGTWTFLEPILAISVKSEGLIRTDPMTGLTTLSYETASGDAGPRGLEPTGNDRVWVDPADPYTVHVTFDFNAMDEIRVFTGVVDPIPVCDPAPDNPILPGTGPANLRLDGQPPVGGRPKYEDDACLYLFEEQQQVALPQTINPVAPSAQNMARGTGPTRELPAGTIVSSFLLHGDAVGSPTAAPATISGTWTFLEPILAISVKSEGLIRTDPMTGLTTLSYETASGDAGPRGLEPTGNDRVWVDPADPYTVHVTFDFNAMDEIRVFTGVVDPIPVCDPAPDNPILPGTGPANLRLDGQPPVGGRPKYEDDACLYLFEEQQQVALPQTINPVAPSAQNMARGTGPTRELPAGTIVSSFLLHGDAVGSPTAAPATISGTWTFLEPILAISVKSEGLIRTDPMTGLTTLSYETASGDAGPRGLEPTGNDRVWVDPADPYTVHVTFDFNAMDEIRVFTGFITPVQKIVIIKDAAPNSAQDFDFTSTGLDLSTFSLDDDADPTLANSIVFWVRAGSDYAVAETPVAGWDLASAGCDDGSPVSDISVSAGEVVTCTFTNIRRGQIVIAKETDPDGSTDIFEFDPSWGANFFLADGQSNTSVELAPNLYSVTELPAAGWTPSAVCDDGSEINAIVVSPGEVVTCTVTNTQARGRIIVDKVAAPAGSAQAFDFTLTGGPGSVSQSFSLADATAPNNSGPLQAGTYAVGETPVSGWDLTGASCDDGSTPDAISLSVGEVVTCTFTNIRRGQIVIAKETDPDGSTDIFEFDPSWGANFFLADGQSNTSVELAPNLYSVTELPAAGWTPSAVCDDGSEINAIVVSPGEVVTCTVTNTQARGRIIVDKVAAPAGSAQAFDFTLTGGPGSVSQSFSLADATAPHNSGPLQAGTYAVGETPVSGWDLTGASCDDGSTPDAISLSPGEVVTCTFTNTERARIIVDKVTNPAGDPQSFNFTLTGGPVPVSQSFSLTDASTPRNSGLLRPGSYAVSEAAQAGWVVTGAVCSDGSPVNAIGLSPGEVVTCTFTNTKGGRIIVDKVTNPAGDPQSFAFNLTGGPGSVNQSFLLTHASAPRDSGALVAGTYSVAESAQTGWDLTGASCDDGSAPNAIGLSAGEVVTCTFTNTKRGRIIVDKVTNPAGDPQSFNFTLTGGPVAVSQSFSLTDASAPRDSGLLRPGTYAASEATQADWSTTSSCDDGSTTGTIGLSPGEVVTCTFTNTRIPANLAIAKVTSNAGPGLGDDFTYTLTVTNAGPGWARGVVVTDNLSPNLFFISAPGCTSALVSGVVRVTCTLGDMPAAPASGSSRTVAITVEARFNCTHVGTSGNNTINGTSGPDVICGGGGGDTLNGGSGNDFIDGFGPTGPISNTASVASPTTPDPSPANNSATVVVTIGGTDGADTIHGQAGNDTILGREGRDRLFGDAGTDQINGGERGDEIDGGDDADVINGDGNVPVDDAGWDDIEGGNGADTINGNAGRDDIRGGADADDISGGPDNDSIQGEGGNDLIDGNAGSDTLSGGGGNDRINGGDDGDNVQGGGGTDILHGNAGDDRIDGGPAASATVGQYNQLYGDSGNDFCSFGPDGSPGTDFRSSSCERPSPGEGWGSGPPGGVVVPLLLLWRRPWRWVSRRPGRSRSEP